jgi:hypothetical protein
MSEQHKSPVNDATEQEYLEDNIGTVAFHLSQPGARLSVEYNGYARLIVDPGEVIEEISRRLSVLIPPVPGPHSIEREIKWLNRIFHSRSI